MAECVNLPAIVDFLCEACTECPKREWSFVGGKFSFSDSKQILLMKSADGRRILDRSLVMKQISSGVKDNFDALLKASTFESQRYDAFSKKDIESICGYFDYFAGWSRKAARILSTDESDESITRTTICLILSDCPIFSTLSRFVAPNYVARRKVRIYVAEKYLVPALTYAFFLCESGMDENEISVFPSNCESFPTDNTFRESVSGVISMEFPLTIVPDLFRNSGNNLHFKKHSACPVLILKSADIGSAISCLVKNTRDLETLWLPNVVYIEEPVFQKFLDTLVFVVNITNEHSLEGVDSVRQAQLNAAVQEKKKEGFEVVTLHHLFHSCMFVVNYEFTLLDSSKTNGKNGQHWISILPIRHEADGVNEINKNKGLGASVWTNDVVQAVSIPLNLNYGTVWINNVGLYDPSVPFSMWNTEGVGSFSGKRMLFENIETFVPTGQIGNDRSSGYDHDRHVLLPKRTLSEVLKLSSGTLQSWSKTGMEDRQCFLKNVADVMEKEWDNSFKVTLNQTSHSVWKLSVDNLRFWSTFFTESAYEQNLFVHNCLVSCRSEPLGIVAILAGTISLDQLFFYVAAALFYGNVVIVGLSTDQRSSIVASELEQLFGKGSVTVLMDTRNGLWQQFTATSSITSVWFHADEDSMDPPLTKTINLQPQTLFNLHVNSEYRAAAKLVETFATKAKCVWLPYLGGGVTKTSY